MILNRITPQASLFLLISAFFMLSTGCGQKKKINGSEYLSQDVLVKLISDMHLMDGITNDMMYYRKFNSGDSIDLYSSIFEKYNTDSKTYERTINEYSKHPHLLNKVYDGVLMNLNLLQDKIEEEEETAPLKKD